MSKLKTPKLELTWVGKGEEPTLEPRILLEQPEYSLENTDSENILIQGDNLLALKALEQEYAGRIKCIYIDPPYNTGSAFQHYNDGLEHSLWLNLIYPRLKILWRLLNKEGSLWISIDDYEMPYIRVVLDEICGRNNFIATNIWQKRYSRENREAIGDAHEYILTYAKDPQRFKSIRNRLPLTKEQKKIYKNPTNDPRGPWRAIPMTAQGYRPNQMYPIKAPGGKTHYPPEGRCWSILEDKFNRLRKEGRIYFGKDKNSQPNIVRFLSEVPGVVPWTWWTSNEVGHTDEAKKEIHKLFGKLNAFDTPKPERLIARVLEIATNEGDLVLDSFLGTGTTVAVAQKMNRRWIGVELGEHAYTLCYPRLKKVVNGEDQGGISKEVNWKGGGGFRFYTLAPSLLKKDNYGNWIISEEYNGEMLAAATAKQEGFNYDPNSEVYWKQGYSTERDFIYTTTQPVTVQMVDQLHDEMKPNESLLIMCKSFQKECKERYTNITIKKIPQALRDKCEFDREDYSLNIVNMPVEQEEINGEEPTSVAKDPKKQQQNSEQQSLF